MNGTKSLFESKTVWGILALVLQHVATTDWSQWQGMLVEHSVIIGGAALALYGRFTASTKIGR